MLILFIVFTVGIVAFHLLEQVAPIRTEYKSGVTRRGYLADVIAALVNGPGLTALTQIGVIGLVTLTPHGVRVMSHWHWAV